MKTNKLWSILMMLVFALGATLSFSSCGGDDVDDGNNGISGMYKTQDEVEIYDGSRLINVMNFINSNTVITYGGVFSKKIGSTSKLIPNHSGWYYTDERMYTYFIKENKIYISNGDILTIINNKLIPDGSSQVFVKW